MIVTDCLPELMEKLGGLYSSRATCIGCVINNELVAGVIYDMYNDISIHVSVWIGSRPSWEFSYAMFDYPFNQLGAKKLIGLIFGDNAKSIRLAEHSGFILEGEVKDYCEKGSMLIYTMTREQCHVLNKRRAA